MALEPNKAAGGDAGVREAIAAAVEAVGRGDAHAAIRTLEATGRALRGDPVGLNLLGGLYLRVGREAEALKVLDFALRKAPGFAEAHCNRGAALEKLGRLDEALAALDRALSLRRAYPLAHFNRGSVLFALGRAPEAVAAHDAALALHAAFPEARLNRGYAHVAAGNPVAALLDFDQALALRPGYPEARIGRLEAMLALEQHRDVLNAADAILHDDPASIPARLLKGRAYKELNRYDEALRTFLAVVEADPQSVEGLMLLAGVQSKLKQFEECLHTLDRAEKLAPRRWEVPLERGTTLVDLGEFEAALALLEEAKRRGAPDTAMEPLRALALASGGRLAEAMPLFERSVARTPRDATLRRNFAFLLLTRGAFERGWEEHEYRIMLPDFPGREFDQLAPRWNGEDLRGKKLLVYREQGLGDTLQFVRYLRILSRQGADITFVAPVTLHALFRRALGGIDITAELGMRRSFDYQSALLSLPRAMKTRLDTIPGEVPYLFPEPALVAKWRDWLGEGGLRVGVLWQGSSTYRSDHHRSIPLARLAPLAAVPGVRLISLQAIGGLDQLDTLPAGMTVERPGPETGDANRGFVELAGLIANLDLVVTIDSAIAHLAGALARPVWVASRFQPEWRWLEGRNDSPWYPTMRLFRQTAPKDWDPVVAAMAAELATLAAAKGG